MAEEEKQAGEGEEGEEAPEFEQKNELNFDLSLERPMDEGIILKVCKEIKTQTNLQKLWLSLHSKVTGKYLDLIAKSFRGIPTQQDVAPCKTLESVGILLSHTPIADEDCVQFLQAVKEISGLSRFKIYVDDTKCGDDTINSIANNIKDLRSLQYCRVWHQKGLDSSVEYLRKVLNKDRKLWRIISEEDLTQYEKF